MPIPRAGTSIASYRVDDSAEVPARAVMAFGNALSAEGAQIIAEAKVEQEKIDTTKVEDAWNQYKNRALDLTVGEKGVLNTKGADAVNVNLLGTTSASLTEARKLIEESLGNDEQKKRFRQRADITDLQTKHQVLSHMVAQQQEYAKTVFTGSEAAARAQISAMPTDPGVFTGARDTLMAQADAYLANNGIKDKASIDSFKAKLNDNLWVTRINALLYSQPTLAESLFRANQAEIKDPEIRLVLQNKTREVALAVIASNVADEIVNDTRTELAKPQAPPGLTTVTTPGTKPADDMRVAPKLQLERDQNRLRLLEDELKDTPNDAALQKEITNAKASIARQQRAIAAGGGDTNQRRVSNDTDALVTNTNGLPNSRDVAAQLPMMTAKINERADALYGKDPNNPDKIAFVKRVTGELQARVSQEVQQLNAIQRQAQGTLLDAVMGISSQPEAPGLMATGGAPAAPQKITSIDQIMKNPTLARAYQLMDVQAKIAVDNMIARNLQATDQGDYAYFRQLFDRIHLEPGDPNKIDFYQQITRPDVANRLSMTQIQQLRQEIDRAETPGMRSPNQMRKAADAMVANYFRTNVMFTAQPERQIAATMRWNEEAGKKIDQYVKEGKDVRSLFMMDSKDSIVSPAYLQTFVNSTPAQGLAEGAAAVKAGGAPVNIARAPDTIKTAADAEAWIKTLPPNVTMFMDSKGQLRQLPQRTGPAAPQYGNRADGTPKGNGFLGPLQTKDGRVSTEISIGVQIDGKEVEIPTLVPGLTKKEIDSLLAGERPSDAIVDKAVEHAKKRMAAGKSPFADASESPTTAPTMDATGKLVNPTTAAQEPAIPKLVIRETVAEKAARMKREAEIRRADRGVAIIEGVQAVGRGVRTAQEAASGALVAGAEALTPPNEAERSARSFRELVRLGSYTPAAESVILDAMDSGMLTPAEERTARAMLRQLATQRKK